jgi:hypothetical protein
MVKFYLAHHLTNQIKDFTSTSIAGSAAIFRFWYKSLTHWTKHICLHSNVMHNSTVTQAPCNKHVWAITCCTTHKCGPGSSVGIVTDYGLDGPGIEPQWGWDFLPVQTGPGAHPASCTMGTGSFPGVKCGRGVLLTTHPLLVPRSWKSRAIPLPTSGPQPGL